MRMSDEDWDTVMNTNLKGALRLRKCFRAIFFGSVRAHHQCRFGHWLDRQRGQCNYAASKAALIASRNPWPGNWGRAGSRERLGAGH